MTITLQFDVTQCDLQTVAFVQAINQSGREGKSICSVFPGASGNASSPETGSSLNGAGLHTVPVEIERKFLVANDTWRQFADEGIKIVQGYIVNANHCSVRIRIAGNGKCTLTTKLPRSGMSRYEFEHDIELREAENLMELCGDKIVEKVRFKITLDGLVWDLDTFSGLNQGLTIAEIELEHEDQTFMRPSWLGEEVTGLEQYQNSRLANEPYSQWTDSSQALALSDLA